MYGNISAAGQRRPNMRVLDFGVPIPFNELNTVEIMEDI